MSGPIARRVPRWKRRAFLVPAGFLLLAACTYFTRSPPYEPPGIRAIGEPETGAHLFLQDCAWCHGARGEGTSRGPNLVGERNGPTLTDFELRTGRMPIQDPSEPLRRREPQYPPEKIEQIVDYVSSLGAQGPDIPHPNPASGDLARGQMLYQDNCAACHSTTGIGGTLTVGAPRDTAGRVARRTDNRVPGLGKSTAVEIAEAMLTGPGTMPVFGDETLSETDRNSVVRYVLYLQRASNRGGGDLGRVGPVAEGAVAWIVGLGALLALARWIGKSVHERG